MNTLMWYIESKNHCIAVVFPLIFYRERERRLASCVFFKFSTKTSSVILSDFLDRLMSQ